MLQEHKLLPLLIVALLDPKATWSRHWLHGATGRTQYCLALKKYNKLFKQVIEVIIKGIYQKKTLPIKNSAKSLDSLDTSLTVDGTSIELFKKLDVKKEQNTTIKPVLSKEGLGTERKLTPKYLHMPRNTRKTEPSFEHTHTLKTCKVYERTSTGTTSTREELPKIIIHSAPSVLNTIPMSKSTPVVSPKTQQEMKERKLCSPTEPIAKNLTDKRLREVDIIPGVPNTILEQALFTHCFSMVTYLTQYRAGRTLFPVNISTRRRHLTMFDMISSMINYIQKFEQNNTNESNSQHFSNLMIILVNVEKNIVMLRKNPNAVGWI